MSSSSLSLKQLEDCNWRKSMISEFLLFIWQAAWILISKKVAKYQQLQRNHQYFVKSVCSWTYKVLKKSSSERSRDCIFLYLRQSSACRNICSFWVETLCQGQKNSEANFCFPRKKWLFFQRETNVLLRVFLTQA